MESCQERPETPRLPFAAVEVISPDGTLTGGSIHVFGRSGK